MRLGLGVAAGVVVVAAILALVALLGDDDDAVDLEAGADAEEPTSVPTTVPATTLPPTTTPETDVPTAETPECPPEDASGPRIEQFDAPPPMCIGESDRFRATLDTTAGTIVWELDASLDPVSVNNFVFLARHHYYDGSTFHRVIDGFVVQGGDPVGNPRGTGSPGYQFTGGTPAEPYEIGDIAMANRGDPSTNGAQFFIITGPNGAALPQQYSPLGRVVEGLDVAQEIQQVETGPGDAPVDDVVVNEVTIEPI